MPSETHSPNRMNWAKILQHPLFVVVLAVITLVSFAFGIWSHFRNQPTRELSYKVDSEEIVDLDELGGNEEIGGITLTVGRQTLIGGKVYVNRVYIWNSGNQEIVEQNFESPLKIQLGSQPLKPGEKDGPTRILYSGIPPEYVIGDLRTGFKFKSIFPKSGIKAVYYSSSKFANLSVIGSLIGGTPGTSGVANLTVDKNERIAFVTLWVLFAAVVFLWMYRIDPPRGAIKSRIGGFTMMLIGSVLFAMIPLVVVTMIYDWYMSAPFS